MTMIFFLSLLVTLQDQVPSEMNKTEVPSVGEIEQLVETDRALSTNNQTEYPMAWALTAALAALGMLAVCVPRFRQPHFVEPAEPANKKSVQRR